MRYKKRHIRMFNNPSTPVLLLPPAVQPLFAFSAAFAYNIAVKVNLYDKVLVVVGARFVNEYIFEQFPGFF